MAIDTTDIQAFTFTELLAACKQAMMHLLVGPGLAYTINGRTYTKNDLKALRETISWLEDLVADETAAEQGGGIVLAEYGERQ
jgi:hypothetical protein